MQRRSASRNARPVRSMLCAFVCAALLCAPSAARASDGDPVKDAAIGWTTGVCTIVYTPVKMVYSALGLPLSGVVFLLGGFNRGAASRVATSAMGGDYVVTPDHILRRKTLRFVGGP